MSGVEEMKKILQYFFQPYRWQSQPLKNKEIVTILLIISVFFIVASISNSRWEFPYFHLFFASFTVILILALYAEIRYTINIGRIRAQTVNKPGFLLANNKFTQIEQTKIVGITALIVVVIFGVGGISIYGSIKVTPTLALCLFYFSVVVYLSIVGYVQYILLFIYLINLARDKVMFTKVGKELTDTLPAEINWLHNLTKLTHFYRATFFTVGLFYIVAFWFYCSSPEFAVTVTYWMHYLLWLIIFIAIVIVFPLVSIIEFYLIKKLVVKVKHAYIAEIKTTLNKKTERTKPSVERRILGEVFSTSVLQSSNYPIKNRLGIIYSAIIAMLNLVGSIDTAIQLGSNLLRH